jgi:MoxR-like ATPase
MTNGGDLQLLDFIRDAREKLFEELQKTMVGQAKPLELVLVSLLASGHCLVVGVPGLGKTMMIKSLGRALSLATSRVQFTPDLMPSDLTGTEVLQEDRDSGRRVFRFVKGPVFTNLLLADEINRTPPKTQAALLEAMQEGQVTIAGSSYELPKPFLVMATQNPVEQEGTYPLPEAQLDRFLLSINMDYPAAEDELRIAAGTNPPEAAGIVPVLDGQRILELQGLVSRVPVAEHVLRYAVALVRATRPGTEAPETSSAYILWGAGPRAVQHLVKVARAWALLCGRPTPSVEDIRTMAVPVLRHRLVMNFRAETESVTADEILAEIIRELPVTVQAV